MQNALIHGWEVEGVEPLEQGRVRSMTKLGLRVHDTIGHAPINAFDAVTMWHVIEHIGSPIEFLQEVRATLVDGGVLALATPNIESLVARATGESWSWLSPPDHLYFYSPKTLPELLLKSGFEVLEVRTRRGQSRNTLLLLLQAVAYRMGVFHSMKSSIERAAYETRTSRSIARKVNIFWMIEMVTEGLSALGVPILFLIWKLGLGDEVLAFARKK
jgi:SAM-dependent methyltransferase